MKTSQKSYPFSQKPQSSQQSLIPRIKKLSIQSLLSLLVEKGLMMAYQTESVEKRKLDILPHLARKIRFLERRNPKSCWYSKESWNLKVKAREPYFFLEIAHLDPGALYSYLKKISLRKRGQIFIRNTQVLRSLRKAAQKWSKSLTDQGKIEAEKSCFVGVPLGLGTR